MDIKESCAVISNSVCNELIVDKLVLFAALDPRISRAPVISDENFSTAGMEVLRIQTPSSDEVSSLEVAPMIAAEAEEHIVPINVNIKKWYALASALKL